MKLRIYNNILLLSFTDALQLTLLKSVFILVEIYEEDHKGCRCFHYYYKNSKSCKNSKVDERIVTSPTIVF